MKWSKNTWNLSAPIYNKILELPFIQGLIDGSLPRDKFIFYIQQDALYLAQYGKILSGIASKLDSPDHIEAFIRFAGDSMAVEKALHESFLSGTNRQSKASPSCLLYTSYLSHQLNNAPVGVAVAAVLPCFWIYKEVGDYILANQTKSDNPYQSWIDTYGGEDFSISVSKAISICDELAEKVSKTQQEDMAKAFLMCTKFEWMFWESAFNEEQWKI